MKIALFGYGKMGKEIEAIALERGHTITARVDSKNPVSSFDYSDTDVIIEFSRPESAVENMTFAMDNGIPIVVGTTGWYEELGQIEATCKEQQGAVLHATNFSLGVNAFFAVNRYLAKIMNQLDEYSAEVVEIHHTEKLDAPSGTGISLTEQIIEHHDRYTQWQNDKAEAVSEKNIIPIASQRLPKVPGTHEVKYKSTIDTIEIKHTAHNRKGFALGSVLAAEWIKGKTGVYTMQDVLNF
mgnify:CR=1 FL=1